MTKRISMWSGPRNISTAMMYSFRARADTEVVDEPLYGHYLAHTGLDHPGRAEVLATMPTDAKSAVDAMLARGDRPVRFYKNMAHHLEGLDWSFLADLDNFLLTRDPREMLPSLAVNIEPTVRDTGLAHQVRLVDRLVDLGRDPIVVVASNVLANPEGVLGALCDRLGLAWDPAMLEWERGPKPEDGSWAPFWYASVHDSTGFGPHQPKEQAFPPALEPVLAECRPLFEQLQSFALEAHG